MGKLDIICTILPFVTEKQFLFFGLISRAWREG